MYSCKAQQTMRWIDELYQKYQLPIWLTEFACPYATDPQEELDYMASVLPLLEESDQVYKYAWYVHRRAETTSFITEAANLFEIGSSKLTALGEFYNNFPANVTPDPPTNPTDPPTNTTTDKPVTDPPVKPYSSGTCRRRKNRK
ncbi:uncharacterized protein LOC132715525 [Ruditapes philippinarum]|uniref:uncharacterized protein LOC132715525 n=1 Tax=Ruditapes philippinarum TaxID=129788 RepID=UPI00295B738D|nr:uncharacterized protein LOC132715525 [Ruditapes philippinarum]